MASDDTLCDTLNGRTFTQNGDLMAAKPRFRRFTEDDRSELERMILALYAEDADGEPMSSEKIQRTVQELARLPQKGEIILFRVAEAVVGYAIIQEDLA